MRRVQGGGRPPGREQRLLDVYNERPVRLSAKVSIPVREHPKVVSFLKNPLKPEFQFNFVGKLLGPRGSSLKQLQEETMTKMAVLGRGSMRNKQQEEELRNSTDPKHSHLRFQTAYTKKSSQHKKTQHTNPATSGRSSMLKSLPLPLLPKLMPGWHSP